MYSTRHRASTPQLLEITVISFLTCFLASPFEMPANISWLLTASLLSTFVPELILYWCFSIIDKNIPQTPFVCIYGTYGPKVYNLCLSLKLLINFQDVPYKEGEMMVMVMMVCECVYVWEWEGSGPCRLMFYHLGNLVSFTTLNTTTVYV